MMGNKQNDQNFDYNYIDNRSTHLLKLLRTQCLISGPVDFQITKVDFILLTGLLKIAHARRKNNSF